MNVLALDLATHTGWALATGDTITSGVQVFDVKRGESPGMRYLRFERWIDEVLVAHPENVAGRACQHLDVRDGWCAHCACDLRDLSRVGLIVYEQTITTGPGSIAREIATGFATRVLGFCARYSVQHQPVWASTLKKWTTGRGNAKKPDMIEAVIRRGWFPKGRTADDNEIDALALLHYALSEIVPTSSVKG